MNKKIVKLALIAIAAMFTIPAIAQDEGNRRGGDREQRMEAKKAEMIAQLDLSPDQQTQMEELNKRYAEQFRTHRQLSEDERSESRAEMKEVRKAYKEEMEALLTDEQQERWKEMKKARKEEMKERKGQDKGKHHRKK